MVINLSESAQEHLSKYLQQVRSCLRGCSSIDPQEVETNIKEHIDNELSGQFQPISSEELDGVLEKLGSPQQWMPEEEITWWRKIIMRLHHGPEDWRLAYISLGLFILALLIRRRISPILFLGSFCAARAVISMVDSSQLRSQKWFVYPPLLLVYAFVGFWLLFWPSILVGVIAQEFDHAKIDMFPWNTGNENTYWLIAIMFIIASGSLWLSILTIIYKKKPIILKTLFRPFADSIKNKLLNWSFGIMVSLTIVCIALGLLMTKYPSWYYFLERVFK